MGILTNNINETGIQILQIEADVLENINAIAYSMALLDTQLRAMQSNEEFTQEDINEMQSLIDGLKIKITEI